MLEYEEYLFPHIRTKKQETATSTVCGISHRQSNMCVVFIILFAQINRTDRTKKREFQWKQTSLVVSVKVVQYRYCDSVCI